MKNITTPVQFMTLAGACGGLVPPWLGAIEAGVSRQRMDELIEADRLPAFTYHGQRFVSLGACVTWSKTQHPAGRPRRLEVRQSLQVCKYYAA